LVMSNVQVRLKRIPKQKHVLKRDMSALEQV
jgi:hypothetical protein